MGRAPAALENIVCHETLPAGRLGPPTHSKNHPTTKSKDETSFCYWLASRLLSPERAALGKTGLATGGLAKDLRAAGADDDGLGV